MADAKDLRELNDIELANRLREAGECTGNGGRDREDPPAERTDRHRRALRGRRCSGVGVNELAAHPRWVPDSNRRQPG